jgi:MFS family permease
LAPAGNKRLVLVAMIFAVAMTFIDQTIVAIAVPELQKDLSLSSTGVQWVVNGYLLALSALFAFGGRLADIAGHRRMVVIGVVAFAAASALCGATPSGDLAEAWIIFWRVVQGGAAAVMFPAALAIVVASFPVGERGKAMAIFFAVTGGLTSIGPLAGGYLTAIDWRAIFWVNIPVAIIALVLTARSKPSDERHPAPLDFRGAVLISGGMGLAVGRSGYLGAASPSASPCSAPSWPSSGAWPTRSYESGFSPTAASRSTTPSCSSSRWPSCRSSSSPASTRSCHSVRAPPRQPCIC